MVAGLSIGDNPTVPVAVPGLCMVMVFPSFALIRRLQLRAFRSIQLSAVLTDIDRRGRAILDALYSHRGALPEARTRTAAPEPPTWAISSIVWTEPPAALQQVHLAVLVQLAQASDSMIAMHVGVGDIIQEGATVATVHSPPGQQTVLPHQSVLDAIRTGPERTFDQDPTLAFRLLVDVALRAQSAAINDQATTVQCLDTLEGLLRHLAERRLGIGEVRDDQGSVRVILAVPSWEDYLTAAVDDLALTAGQSPMVLARIHSMLEDLYLVVPVDRRPVIVDRQRLVDAQLRASYQLAWQHLTRTTDPDGVGAG